MMLYLLRHAEAEASASSDAARRLTAKGEEQAGRTGTFCRNHGIEPALILSSPVTRSLQTAKIVARNFKCLDLVEVSWAACGMDPFKAADELASYKKLPSILLVGHQPDLGALAALLLGCADVGALHVRKSLLCAIDVSRGFRHGVLEFFMPPKLMS